VLGSGAIDDTSHNAKPIGFTFSYNGGAYTQFSVNCNGFLAMGATVASSYTPIGSGTSNNVVSALGMDLQGNTGGELRYETAPGRPVEGL
jgi:hypothetical protein